MPPTRNVFLRSSGADLHAYREAVAKDIARMDGWQYIRMEDFGARDAMVDEYCQRMARERHLFIGIIGHRFGSGPPGTTESYTQREYAAAKQARVPSLVFFAPDDFPIPANLREGYAKRKAQAKFRESIREHRMPGVPFVRFLR